MVQVSGVLIDKISRLGLEGSIWLTKPDGTPLEYYGYALAANNYHWTIYQDVAPGNYKVGFNAGGKYWVGHTDVLECTRDRSDIACEAIPKTDSGLRGTISDQDRNPLNQVLVVIEGTSIEGKAYADQTNTDSTGFYILTGVPPGSYYVTTYKVSYINVFRDPVTIAPSQYVTKNYIMKKISPIPTDKGILEGVVFSTDSSTAVVGANVSAIGPETKNTTSSSDGTYLMELLPGTYKVEATKGDQSSGEQGVTIVVGQRMGLPLYLSLATAQVQGTVRDKGTKGGLAQASLTFTRQGRDPKTVTADDVGVYSTPLYIGSNAVAITKQGYKPLSSSINVLPDKVNEFDFELEPEGAIKLPWWLWLAPAALGAVLVGREAIKRTK